MTYSSRVRPERNQTTSPTTSAMSAGYAMAWEPGHCGNVVMSAVYAAVTTTPATTKPR